MDLTKLIKKLGTAEPTGDAVLSIYINAEINNSGGRDFPIWLKKALSEQTGRFADDEVAAEKFETIRERIEAFAADGVDNATRGIAIFAGLGEKPLFETVELAVPFNDNEIFVTGRPYVFPLVRALEQNPKYAVLWADTNKADIYVFGGENRIRSENTADDKVGTIQNEVTNRSQVGGWSQARYQRSIDNFHLQHAKEVVAELEQVVRDRHIEKLVLCGDEASIMPVLRPQLSKPLEEKVVATVNMSQYDSPEDIRAKTSAVLSDENDELDAMKVQDVEDAAKAAAGMGTLGVEDTLRALANGQVQELVMTAAIDSIEYSEAQVKKILAEYRPGDDLVGIDTDRSTRYSGDIADQLVLGAINTDAKITFIENHALLADSGGVGSILRYNIDSAANG